MVIANISSSLEWKNSRSRLSQAWHCWHLNSGHLHPFTRFHKCISYSSCHYETGAFVLGYKGDRSEEPRDQLSWDALICDSCDASIRCEAARTSWSKDEPLLPGSRAREHNIQWIHWMKDLYFIGPWDVFLSRARGSEHDPLIFLFLNTVGKSAVSELPMANPLRKFPLKLLATNFINQLHYILTYLHTLHYIRLDYITLHACMHACMHACIHTHIHT